MAGLLLPALARAKARAQSIYCLNNTHQLALAWLIYSDDHNGRLAYNLGGDVKVRGVAPSTNLNWVNNILDWGLKADNTNLAGITEASLGPYANKTTGIYRCPSDNVLSAAQRNAGWSGRVRSYSMNAMVGDAGDLSQSGRNANNPAYVQFFNLASIRQPFKIFVFLDEHPDSINDGYFVNTPTYNAGPYGGPSEWTDLPASYHNGAANFSFADGHSEPHRWRCPSTLQPAVAEAVNLPLDVPPNQHTDFDWVIARMSIYESH
jgi:prepilin-type processing-associated H-X9-DG protein